MHFSIAFAGFIKSQVLHFHPALSGDGFSPAAPQLNPPVPLLVVVVTVVVVEGVGPNPAKFGLNADSASLDTPNENPDEVVGVDEVEFDVPNRDGPGGGVGIEKVFPEPELEEDVPGLGASQTVHFSLANAGFIRSQDPHFHPSVLVVGGFNPAASQLNPPGPEPVEVVVVVEALPEPHTGGVGGGFGMENDGATEDFPAPGFGVSHTAHFSVADAGFIKSQVPHFQPSVLVLGGCNPAALQSNPPELELVVAVDTAAFVVVELVPKGREVEGGLGIENEGDTTGPVAPGLGASQTVHFSAAVAGFIKSQVPHFHPSCFGGGFKPAVTQLNPPFVVGGTVIAGEVNAEAGRVVALVLVPALLRLEGPAELEERLQVSCVGISSSTVPLTSFSALNSPELLTSLIVLSGSMKISIGSSEMAIERTSALAFLGEVAVVGETEDAEEAVSSLSALMLNRSFEGSLGADDLRLKKDLPAAVGEIVGVDEGVPFRPTVCN